MARGLQALATSPALTSGDYASLREQAVSVAAHNSAGGVALRRLQRPTCREYLLPFGTHPMPVTTDPVLLAADVRALASQRIVVSDLYSGATGQRLYVSIDEPVIFDTQAAYLLTMAITPERIIKMLRLSPPLAGEGWLAAVVGSDGRVIARTRDYARFAGASATPDLLAAARQTSSGWLQSRNLEGHDVFTAFQTSTNGWITVVSVPVSVLNAPVYALWRILALIIGLVLLATSLGAWAYGAYIGRDIALLTVNAQRLGEHAPLVRSRSTIREVSSVQKALSAAFERSDDLMRELDHRVKNMLSVVQAMARRTSTDPAQQDTIVRRIAALSKAQEALSDNRWKGRTFSSLSILFWEQMACQPKSKVPLFCSHQRLHLASHRPPRNWLQMHGDMDRLVQMAPSQSSGRSRMTPFCWIGWRLGPLASPTFALPSASRSLECASKGNSAARYTLRRRSTV